MPLGTLAFGFLPGLLLYNVQNDCFGKVLKYNQSKAKFRVCFRSVKSRFWVAFRLAFLAI